MCDRKKVREKKKERKKLFEMKFRNAKDKQANKMRSKRKRKYALHSDKWEKEREGLCEGGQGLRYLVQIPENANLFQHFYAVHRKRQEKMRIK